MNDVKECRRVDRAGHDRLVLCGKAQAAIREIDINGKDPYLAGKLAQVLQSLVPDREARYSREPRAGQELAKIAERCRENLGLLPAQCTQLDETGKLAR